MKCPHCDHDIATATVHGETADACVACGGIWLETGELRPFFERMLAHNPELHLDEATPSNVPLAATFYKSGRNCPACEQQMEKTYYAYDSGIVIEHCIPCGGTWFDAAKIGQLAAYIRDNSRPVKYSDDAADDESHEETLSAEDRLPTLNPTLALVMVGVCYVVLVFACYNLYHVGFAIQRGRASLEWVETHGTLLEMTTQVTPKGFGRSRTNVYIMDQRYTYELEGKLYVGDATWPNGDDSMTNNSLEAHIKEGFFVPGTKTTVYVDPDEPHRSSLRRGTNPFRKPKDLLILIVYALVSGSGILYITRSLVHRYRST